jgi:hypothetical protein
MKELRTLFAIYLSCIILVIACSKVVPTPTIELGVQAKMTQINSVNPPISTGKVIANLSVTPGAKYSLQLIDLKGDVKSVTGFTADKDLIIKELDYSDVNSGDYTVTLIDISGVEYKRNITIKK